MKGLSQKICSLLLVVALCSFYSLAGEHHWLMKDGTGFSALKDECMPRVPLEIMDGEKVSWAREDDRGYFLTFDGGIVSCPSANLRYDDGMALTVKFAAHLSNPAAREWLALVTCGNSYDQGYSIWLNRNGKVLVTFPKATNWYKLIDTKLQDMRDYTLQVVRGENRVQIALDGKLVADYECKGEVLFNPGQRFTIGNRSWKYYGNVYELHIRDFSKGAFQEKPKGVEAKPACPADEIVPVPDVIDPEGTVLLKDFRKFSPRPLENTNMIRGAWTFRPGVGFFKPVTEDAFCFSSDETDSTLSCNPGLSGKYDIYVGVRATNNETSCIMSVGDESVWLQIGNAGPSRHPNTEVLLMHDMDMDGKSIVLHPGGNALIGYFKFIPSSNRRKIDYPAWKCVKLQHGVSDFSVINQKKVEELIAKHTLRERVHVDEREEVKPSDASISRGFMLEAHDWMDLVFVNDKLQKDEPAPLLRAIACPGEYEPMTLVVHGLQDCGDVSLSLDDAFGGSGIEAEVTVVRSIPKRTTNYTGRSEFIIGPQYLCRQNHLTLQKGDTRQFWITVHVPEGLLGGTYKGSFELKTGKARVRIPAEVTVRPFSLVSTNDVCTGFFGTERRPDVLCQYAKDQVAHGMNTFILYLSSMLEFKRDAEGRYVIDMDKSQLFKLAERIHDIGIKRIVIAVHGITEMFYTMEDGRRQYIDLIRQIMQFGKEKGYPPFYFYTIDEVLSNPPRLKMAIWEAEAIHEAGGFVWSDHIWYKTSRPYQKEVDQMAKNIDVFVNRFNNKRLWYVDSWSEMEDEAERLGKEVWSYNIDNALTFSQTAMKRFAFGWFFRTLGSKTRGQMVWAYNHWGGSPYSDLDSSTDWMYCYPKVKDSPGGFCIDFEATREGVDDLRYIATLEQRIEAAKKAGRNADSAVSLLAELKGSFDFGEKFVSKSVFLNSSFEKQWAASDGGRGLFSESVIRLRKEWGFDYLLEGLFCSGRFNLPVGWSFEDYHNARERIAEEIIIIDRAQ